MGGGIGRWRRRDWEAAIWASGVGRRDWEAAAPGRIGRQRLLAVPSSEALLVAPDGGAVVAVELWWREVPA